MFRFCKMRSLLLIFISVFVLAGCSSSTTAPNGGVQVAAPTSDSIYFVYSGARSGSLRIVAPKDGGPDSFITTAKVTQHLHDTTGVGYFIIRDTVPSGWQASSGL